MIAEEHQATRLALDFYANGNLFESSKVTLAISILDAETID